MGAEAEYKFRYQINTIVNCFEECDNFDEVRACIVDRIKPKYPPHKIHDAIRKSAMSRKP